MTKPSNSKDNMATIAPVEEAKQPEVVTTPAEEKKQPQTAPTPATPRVSHKYLCVVCAEKKHLSLKKGSYDHIQCDFCGERHTGGLESDYE